MFKRNWNLDYTCQDYEYAFFIRGMGLFFIRLSIDRKGGLIGVVQMVNSTESAKQFTYALKVGSGPQGACYNAVVRVYLYKLYITFFLSNLYGYIFSNKVTIFITLVIN